MSDLRKTDQRGRFRAVETFVAGNAAAGDYLGDTTASEGVPVGAGTLDRVHINSGTADATGLGATVHNVTRGTSEAITFASATYDRQETDLYFGEGDELAFEITAVDGTTPAADTQVVFEQEITPAPMN